MSMNKVALQEALHKLNILDESKMRLIEDDFTIPKKQVVSQEDTNKYCDAAYSKAENNGGKPYFMLMQCDTASTIYRNIKVWCKEHGLSYKTFIPETSDVGEAKYIFEDRNHADVIILDDFHKGLEEVKKEYIQSISKNRAAKLIIALYRKGTPVPSMYKKMFNQVVDVFSFAENDVEDERVKRAFEKVRKANESYKRNKKLRENYSVVDLETGDRFGNFSSIDQAKSKAINYCKQCKCNAAVIDDDFNVIAGYNKSGKEINRTNESLKRNKKLIEADDNSSVITELMDDFYASDIIDMIFDDVMNMINKQLEPYNLTASNFKQFDDDNYGFYVTGKESDMKDWYETQCPEDQGWESWEELKSNNSKVVTMESLKRKVNECLRSLHEAEMSPEDKVDSEVLAKLYTKLQNHPGGRLSKAEQQVMDKYGLTRDAKWIGDDNTTLVGSTIRNTKNVGKVNLADRARKMKTRKNYYPRQMDLRKKTPLEIDREDDNVKMQNPYNDMKREVNYRNRQTDY